MKSTESPIANANQIPGYEILELLDKGGMGAVYLARQLALGRLVAIKFLALADDPLLGDKIARFRREAELMAKVSHPNVLSVFDGGSVEGRPYLVMEYVEGGDLRRLMKSGRPMAIERVLPMVESVGDALQCLHRHGILHRDLKPENILIHAEGHPKVSDFGIAVLRTGISDLTRTSLGLGTEGYVAPEQRYRLPVDERADLYSLAALTYELLTGERPLGIIRPASAFNNRLNAGVDMVLLRALEEDPHDRYPTIREFLNDLKFSLQSSGPVRRRSATILGALAMILLVLAVLQLTWHRNGGPNPIILEDSLDQPALSDQNPEAEPTNPAVELDATSSEEHTRLWAAVVWKSLGQPEGLDAAIWYETERRLRLQQAGIPWRTENFLNMAFVLIPSGEFVMGSSAEDPEALLSEMPQHSVLLTQPIYMGVHEVTVGQFRAFVEETGYISQAQRPGQGGSIFDPETQSIVTDSRYNWTNPGYALPVEDDHPVVQIGREDAEAFCAWLSERDGLAYRLPTEAEWEHACRGWQETRWWFGDDPAMIGTYAWYQPNAVGGPRPVGQKSPNLFGLHDPYGNVWELCQDWYGAYSEARQVNPRGPAVGDHHVIRGGDWGLRAEGLRSATRQANPHESGYFTIGFRVCRELTDQKKATLP